MQRSTGSSNTYYNHNAGSSKGTLKRKASSSAENSEGEIQNSEGDQFQGQSEDSGTSSNSPVPSAVARERTELETLIRMSEITMDYPTLEAWEQAKASIVRNYYEREGGLVNPVDRSASFVRLSTSTGTTNCSQAEGVGPIRQPKQITKQPQKPKKVKPASVVTPAAPATLTVSGSSEAAFGDVRDSGPVTRSSTKKDSAAKAGTVGKKARAAAGRVSRAAARAGTGVTVPRNPVARAAPSNIVASAPAGDLTAVQPAANRYVTGFAGLVRTLQSGNINTGVLTALQSLRNVNDPTQQQQQQVVIAEAFSFARMFTVGDVMSVQPVLNPAAVPGSGTNRYVTGFAGLVRTLQSGNINTGVLTALQSLRDVNDLTQQQQQQVVIAEAFSFARMFTVV
eukprot:gene8833-10445_t